MSLEELMRLINLNNRADGRTQLMVKYNPLVKVHNGHPVIKIGDVKFLCVTRDTRNFNQYLYSAGSSSSKRELLLLDYDSKPLCNAYNKLLKNIKDERDPDSILQIINNFTRTIFVSTDIDSIVQNKQELIPLSKFLEESKGVCRHRGLFNCYLLSRLKEDNLLNGEVIHYRCTLPEQEGGDAHTWTLFKSDNGKLYSLDSMWNRYYCITDNFDEFAKCYRSAIGDDIKKRYMNGAQDEKRINNIQERVHVKENGQKSLHAQYDAIINDDERNQFVVELLSLEKQERLKILAHQYQANPKNILGLSKYLIANQGWNNLSPNPSPNYETALREVEGIAQIYLRKELVPDVLKVFKTEQLLKVLLAERGEPVSKKVQALNDFVGSEFYGWLSTEIIQPMEEQRKRLGGDGSPHGVEKYTLFTTIPENINTIITENYNKPHNLKDKLLGEITKLAEKDNIGDHKNPFRDFFKAILGILLGVALTVTVVGAVAVSCAIGYGRYANTFFRPCSLGAVKTAQKKLNRLDEGEIDSMLKQPEQISSPANSVAM